MGLKSYLKARREDGTFTINKGMIPIKVLISN